MAMVLIPRGTDHTFKVISDHPCRHYASFTPGGLENFFAEIATIDLRIPEDMEAVIEAADQHNVTFTGPPV